MASLRELTLPESGTAILLLWINRSLEVLWLLTVVLVPLAFLGPNFGEWSSVLGSFELPKIVLLRTLVGLMAALWLVEWGLKGQLHAVPISESRAATHRSWSPLAGLWGWLRAEPTRWLIVAAAFFLGATLLSTLLSASVNVSLWGGCPWPRQLLHLYECCLRSSLRGCRNPSKNH